MKIDSKNTILFLSVVVLIMIGVSVFLLNKNGEADEQNMEAKKIQSVSPSNETEVMEQEVNGTDFSQIDSEMNQMEVELEGY